MRKTIEKQRPQIKISNSFTPSAVVSRRVGDPAGPCSNRSAHDFSTIPILSNPAPLPLQAKLEISQPGDPLEQEADRVADQVMRMTEEDSAASVGSTGAASLQRKCAECREEEKEEDKKTKEDQDKLQRKASGPESISGAHSA